MVGKNVNHSEIIKGLPGHNKKNAYKPRGWNMDFQSYDPPLATKILEQDKKGGAVVVMLGALILGLIIAACLGTL